MPAYIIRLDDACPCMHHENWARMESLLDKYHIKPLVGVIPDSLDKDFNWPKAGNFWTETVPGWAAKGWVIAQHGCHHLFMPHIKSEFTGLSCEEQDALIRKGYEIMRGHGITPACFFSPAYNFDNTTIDVCRNTGYFEFLSDGYALFPHTYKGMLFLPVLSNRLNMILPVGVLTFVYHPNTMSNEMFDDLEVILRRKRFSEVKTILNNANQKRKRTIVDVLLQTLMGKRRERKGIYARFMFD